MTYDMMVDCDKCRTTIGWSKQDLSDEEILCVTCGEALDEENDN